MEMETEAQKFASYFVRKAHLFDALINSNLERYTKNLSYIDAYNFRTKHTFNFIDGSLIEVDAKNSKGEDTYFKITVIYN